MPPTQTEVAQREHIACNTCKLIAEVASLVSVKADGQGLSFNVE